MEKENQDGVLCQKIGAANTVGDLRKLLEPYGDEVGFGFRNQPMQSLFEIDSKFIVFQ